VLSRPILLGHRGARATKSIPENTFASFDQALTDGCDGFEFDVRLTADGQAVVVHDPQSRGVEIARATAQEVSWLPPLQDVLQRYRDSAFLDIELKVPGLEPMILNLLRKYAPSRGFVVSSFLPEVLRSVRTKSSSIPLGLICETKPQLGEWRQSPVEYVIPHHQLASNDLVRELHEAGKRIIVWTVNNQASMRRFVKAGLDGIISDDAKLLGETLRR
jgi:glycerophosphoryl diester phosphodiesterase